MILYPEIPLNSLISSSNFFVNSKQDTTTHLLEWLKLRRLTIASIDKDMEKVEFSYTTTRNIKLTTTLKNTLTIS